MTGSFVTGGFLPSNATGACGAYSNAGFDSTETWLRGGWSIDANGIAEVTTAYPGYHTGCT
jgi:hypothetical protein